MFTRWSCSNKNVWPLPPLSDSRISTIGSACTRCESEFWSGSGSLGLFPPSPMTCKSHCTRACWTRFPGLWPRDLQVRMFLKLYSTLQDLKMHSRDNPCHPMCEDHLSSPCDLANRRLNARHCFQPMSNDWMRWVRLQPQMTSQCWNWTSRTLHTAEVQPTGSPPPEPSMSRHGRGFSH